MTDEPSTNNKNNSKYELPNSFQNRFASNKCKCYLI